jgi:hypothetical protein
MKIILRALGLLGLVCAISISSFADESKSLGVSAGLEMSFGDALQYGEEGFEFWVKPNLSLDFFQTGFSLGIKFAQPLYPSHSGLEQEFELSENYVFYLPSNGFFARVGNVNPITLSKPAVANGFVYGGIGIGDFAQDIQFHYLSGDQFDLHRIVLVSAYTFSFASVSITGQLELVIPLIEGDVALGPVLGVSYAF